MRCLAIDPGNESGWAVFDQGTLVACGVWHGYPHPAQSMRFDRAIIEMPQFYRAGLSKGDPNDLAKVVLGVGGYKARLEDAGATVTLVLPAEWKGQQNKTISNARSYAALSDEEKSVVDLAGRGLNKKELTDLKDAVGLGLYAKRARIW